MKHLSFLAAIIVLFAGGVEAQTVSGGGSVQTANPSQSIGLTQVNGTASTVMTSDSAPALSQAIAPTWTNLHIFTANVRVNVGAAATPSFNFVGDTTTGLYQCGAAGKIGFALNGSAAFCMDGNRFMGTVNAVYCFSPFGTVSSCDTGLSRLSAGVTAFGTGAVGNVSGGWQASTGQLGSGTALTLTAGALGMNKITASGSAPGASGMKLEAVCGTNAGSLKIIAYAGTSTTAVTVVDNVGSGVTGC